MHVRVRNGQPLVVLTAGGRYALVVEPAGEIKVASLCGVTPCYEGSVEPTAEQAATLVALRGLTSNVIRVDG